MQIETNHHVPRPVAKEGLKVKALSRVNPIRHDQEGTLASLVAAQQAPLEATPGLAGLQGKRQDKHFHGERRTYCRRFEHLPVLEELRSGIDRRKHMQRAGDVAEHVDEIV